ncbi:hypothetical protein HGM15179_020877 [Zosterops borbonicus]|uniref:Ig-like domain-containing protein n=1 Tax=Zosterops borbonicus TaxID=364589 RepID=A0A8K1FY98_9PASS|nr:hypothetical protein HGM15179_020877 [Zosterops borbonicus]
MEDAGTYSVNLDGKISTFILRVYRELTEPTVTCEAQDCLDKVCLFSLRCSVRGPDTGFGNISYTWRGWDQRREERPVVLTVVDKSSLDNLEPLRCTARNAVSSRSVTITTPEELCPGAPLGRGVRIRLIAATGPTVILLLFLVLYCKSKGYCPASAACTARKARVVSASSEISATAGPGHRGCSQAMSWLGPAPGLAWDKHGTESRRAFSALPQITDLPEPEPELTMVQLGPEPGLAMDLLRPEPGLTMDQLRPEPGLAMDQLRPEPGLTMDQLGPEPVPFSNQLGPVPGPALDHCGPAQGQAIDQCQPWTSSDQSWDWPWTSVTRTGTAHGPVQTRPSTGLGPVPTSTRVGQGPAQTSAGTEPKPARLARCQWGPPDG